jgi:DNA-binding SARP family transcriptional activator
VELVFRILGPLEVTSPEGPLRLGGPRQRSVLAILLLERNTVVSIDRLAEELYGGVPPVSAVTQVHRQISELRLLLEPDRPPGTAGSVIETRPPGYRLRVPPDALDLLVVEGLADDAGTALGAGEAETAVRLYRQALAQWRGAPLADLAFEPFARPAIARLDDLRLAIVERCLAAELALGRGAELVAELEQLVQDNPLDERLRAHLMVALYRAGRQADALERFRAGRAALVEAFGLEPTPALKELERRVLQQDPGLDATGRRPSAAVPRDAPRTVLLAAWEGAPLDRLAALGRGLAALDRHELLMTRVVPSEELLAAAVSATRAASDELRWAGVMCRAAAFVSRSPGADTARLAMTHEADAAVLDASRDLTRDGPLPEAIADMLERCPCDVALLAAPAPPALENGVSVIFGGGDHDWAAAELGAGLAAGAGVPLRLIGARGTGGDASRLLASASIAIQRVVGVDADPVLVDAGPRGVVEAAGASGAVVAGLSPRWRGEGLGETRRALIATGTPTLIVHRGTRPGGLAPRERLTRFTWSLAGAG